MSAQGSCAVPMPLVRTRSLGQDKQQGWAWSPAADSHAFVSLSCVLLVSTLLSTHSFSKSLQSTKAGPCWAPWLSMGSSWSSGPTAP